MLREPDGYAPPAGTRSMRKWEAIIAAFMGDHIEQLRLMQRTGARGRIFAYLIEETLNAVGESCRREPVFKHRDPNPWCVTFAHDNGIKLRTHVSYNPDFILNDGTWVEATLSENTAYAKLFRYGHQAERLLVVWLDKDTGHHKSVCEKTPFPNAEVLSVSSFYLRLSARENGETLICRLELRQPDPGENHPRSPQEESSGGRCIVARAETRYCRFAPVKGMADGKRIRSRS